MIDTKARMTLGAIALFCFTVFWGRRKTGPWPTSRAEDSRDLYRTMRLSPDAYDATGDGGELGVEQQEGG